MKWALIVLGAIAALALLVLVIGLMKPASHTASISVQLAAPPDTVWQVISNVPDVPSWFDQVKSVEPLPDHEGRPSFRENYGGFEATTVLREATPLSRMVKEILPTGPFYGTWTWELSPEGTGTRLVITERGTVDNAFIRGMMLFHDNEKTLRDYAAALARRLTS